MKKKSRNYAMVGFGGKCEKFRCAPSVSLSPSTNGRHRNAQKKGAYNVSCKRTGKVEMVKKKKGLLERPGKHSVPRDEMGRKVKGGENKSRKTRGSKDLNKNMGELLHGRVKEKFNSNWGAGVEK